MLRLAMVVAGVLAMTVRGQGQVGQTPAPAAVDYDTFMQQDDQGRIETFNRVTPENRAELVRTQIQRWVDKNRPRLTAEQLKVMGENLAFVTADLYRQPVADELKAKAKELEARSIAVSPRTRAS
ncbi:MAG TPA: hypothetical protein VKE94_23370 [Gemmataceae bacterium]|nr:hypothetical protein [Gemmataceae bacterium]